LAGGPNALERMVQNPPTVAPRGGIVPPSDVQNKGRRAPTDTLRGRRAASSPGKPSAGR